MMLLPGSIHACIDSEYFMTNIVLCPKLVEILLLSFCFEFSLELVFLLQWFFSQNELNGCHFVLMSYNLRVRFKNNVQRPRHMDPKKITRIEHYFKLKNSSCQGISGVPSTLPRRKCQ